MNVDLELYRVFYTVAKHKHMTRASEELHISQPAISQSIKRNDRSKIFYQRLLTNKIYLIKYYLQKGFKEEVSWNAMTSPLSEPDRREFPRR